MWVVFSLLSALFAGLTAILAKCGIKETDSSLATAIRTVVVLIFSWLMVLIVGSVNNVENISPYSWLFLFLSALATGASWLCYFKALQLGDINKVVPVDKSSIVLTVILASIFLGEGIGPIKIVALSLIGIGTYMMIQKKGNTKESLPDAEKRRVDNRSKSWLIYAIASALFASLTAILAKVGIEGVESNLATAIRTSFVLVFAWGIVFLKRKNIVIKKSSPKEIIFIILSGLATGASWLCYYKALQDGPASIVVPIDKLSIVVAIIFSYFVFKEKLSKKALIGLILIVIGTFIMLFSL